MSDYSAIMIILWYTLVFLAFIVHPMLLACGKQVSTARWTMLIVYQAITVYFGYTLA